MSIESSFVRAAAVAATLASGCAHQPEVQSTNQAAIVSQEISPKLTIPLNEVLRRLEAVCGENINDCRCEKNVIQTTDGDKIESTDCSRVNDPARISLLKTNHGTTTVVTNGHEHLATSTMKCESGKTNNIKVAQICGFINRAKALAAKIMGGNQKVQ